MLYPDLMVTQSAALRRRELQRTGADPYAQPRATRVYRANGLPRRVRQLGDQLGCRLVQWGQRLQQYGEPQSLLRKPTETQGWVSNEFIQESRR